MKVEHRPPAGYDGRWHRGAVRFRIGSDFPDPAGIPIRQTVGAAMV